MWIFFIRGVTIDNLKQLENKPSDNDKFTSLVIDGKRQSAQSLSKNVGHGSSRHDFVGEADIALRTSFSDTIRKQAICLGVYGG